MQEDPMLNRLGSGVAVSIRARHGVDAHSRASARMAAARRAGLLVAVAIGLMTGCEDKRISVEQLREREQSIATTQPVQIVPPQLAVAEIRPQRVAAGDVLRLKMYGLGDEVYTPTELELRVHENGEIVIPVVGAVQVAGKDLGQVEQAIIAAHVPRVVKDFAVLVQLSGPQNTTVLVQGAASSPGVVRLADNERNPIYALASAGGFNMASSGRITVKPIRPDRPETSYDFNDINDVRRALTAAPLESGDMVVVEAAPSSAVYVNGLVRQPGPVPLPARATIGVQQAIAAAGGLRDDLIIKEGTLVRTLPNGERVHVKVELDALMAGEGQEVALCAGDILVVPHTVETALQDWANRNIQFGPFSLGVRYDPLAQYNAERAIRSNTNNNNLIQSIRQSLQSGISGAFQPAVVP
ncbi:MAG: polysaccharide biosynthesis/export family protein [Phycisphaerales bacterium]|nr:polysaccharide biosynthesis/export family protein [Phycisphaerales bacterium]